MKENKHLKKMFRMWNPAATYLIFFTFLFLIFIFAETFLFNYLYKMIVSNTNVVYFVFMYIPVFLIVGCIIFKIIGKTYNTYYKTFFSKIEKYENQLQISPIIEELEYQRSIAITKKSKCKRELNLILSKLDMNGDFNKFISMINTIYSNNTVHDTNLLIDYWLMHAYLELNYMKDANDMLKKYNKIKEIKNKKNQKIINHYLYKLMCLEYDLYSDNNLNDIKKELIDMLDLKIALVDSIVIHYDLGLLYLKKKDYVNAKKNFRYVVENGNEHFLVKKCKVMLKKIEKK